MPNIGPAELIIILVIAIVFIGPGKLPDVGAALGKSIREFRKASGDLSEATRVDTSPLPPAAPVAPVVAASPAAPVLGSAPVAPVVDAAPAPSIEPGLTTPIAPGGPAPSGTAPQPGAGDEAAHPPA